MNEVLPVEVRKTVFSYCENDSLYNSMLTCKNFYEDIKNVKFIWQNRTFVVTPRLKFPLSTFQENGIVIKRLIVTFALLRANVLNNMDLVKMSNRYEKIMATKNLTSLEFYQIRIIDYIEYDHKCFDCIGFIGINMSTPRRKPLGVFQTKKTIVEFKDCTIKGHYRVRTTFKIDADVVVFNNTLITKEFTVTSSRVRPQSEIRFVKKELNESSMITLLCMFGNAKSICLELLPNAVIPRGVNFVNNLRQLITRPNVLAFNECMFRQISRSEFPHAEYDKFIYVTNAKVGRANVELSNVLVRIRKCFPKVKVVHMKNTISGKMYKCTLDHNNINVKRDETKSAIIDMEIVNEKNKEYMKLVSTANKTIKELNVNTENEKYNTTIRKVINLVSNKENPMFINELKNSFDDLKEIIRYENTMDSLQMSYRQQLYMIENVKTVVEIYEALFLYTENGKGYIDELKTYINKIETVKINTVYDTPSVKLVKKKQIEQALEKFPNLVNPIAENIDNLYKEAKIPLNCDTFLYEEDDSKYEKDDDGNLEFQLDTSHYPKTDDDEKEDDDDSFLGSTLHSCQDDGFFEFSTTAELNKNPFSYRNMQKRNSYVEKDDDEYYTLAQKDNNFSHLDIDLQIAMSTVYFDN